MATAWDSSRRWKLTLSLMHMALCLRMYPTTKANRRQLRLAQQRLMHLTACARSLYAGAKGASKHQLPLASSTSSSHRFWRMRSGFEASAALVSYLS